MNNLSFGFGWLFQGKQDGKTGSLSWCGINGQAALVIVFNDHLGYIQPQSGSLTRWLGGIKRLKDPLLHIRVYAGAGIPDVDFDKIGRAHV